jgi:hypothetical protein
MSSINKYDIKINDFYFKILNKNTTKDPERPIVNIQSSTDKNLSKDINHFSVYLSLGDIGLACCKLYNENNLNDYIQSSFIHIELQHCINGIFETLGESTECFFNKNVKDINDHIIDKERQIDESPFKNYNSFNYNLNMFSYELKTLYEYLNYFQLFGLSFQNKENNFYVYFHKVELKLKEKKDNLDNIVLYFCNTYINKFKNNDVIYYKNIYLPVLLTTNNDDKITKFGTFTKYILAGNYICKVTEINKKNRYEIIFPLSEIKIDINKEKEEKQNKLLVKKHLSEKNDLLNKHKEELDAIKDTTMNFSKKMSHILQRDDQIKKHKQKFEELKKKIENQKDHDALEVIQQKEIAVQRIVFKKEIAKLSDALKPQKIQEQHKIIDEITKQYNDERKKLINLHEKEDKEQEKQFKQNLNEREIKIEATLLGQYEQHKQHLKFLEKKAKKQQESESAAISVASGALAATSASAAASAATSALAATTSVSTATGASATTTASTAPSASRASGASPLAAAKAPSPSPSPSPSASRASGASPLAAAKAPSPSPSPLAAAKAPSPSPSPSPLAAAKAPSPSPSPSPLAAAKAPSPLAAAKAPSPLPSPIASLATISPTAAKTPSPIASLATTSPIASLATTTLVTTSSPIIPTNKIHKLKILIDDHFKKINII